MIVPVAEAELPAINPTHHINSVSSGMLPVAQLAIPVQGPTHDYIKHEDSPLR
jgi:hypothetical protein